MATALILAYAILFVATAFMANRFFALWVLACFTLAWLTALLMLLLKYMLPVTYLLVTVGYAGLMLAFAFGLAVFAASATKVQRTAVLKILGATTVWAIIVACTTWGIL